MFAVSSPRSLHQDIPLKRLAFSHSLRRVVSGILEQMTRIPADQEHAR